MNKYRFNIALRGVPLKERPNCYVCDKHGGSTEWHHITPISEQVKNFENESYFFYDETFLNIQVSLCRNCHFYLHKLYKTPISEMKSFFIMLKSNGYTLKENLLFCDLLTKYQNPNESNY